MSFFGDLFGGDGGTGDAYGQYATDLQGLGAKYDPWVQQGQQAFGRFGTESAQGLESPTALQDRLAGLYSASPYQQNVMQDVSRQMNQQAANTGMVGSTAQQKALKGQMANLSGQFQDQYVGRGMNQYNQALKNQMMQAQLGMGGLQQQTGLMQEAALAPVMRAQQEAAQSGGMWGDILGLAGSLFGGPLGGMAGSMAGSLFGSSAPNVSGSVARAMGR